MTRIEKRFTENPKPLLSIYYTAGFPSLESTREILRELQAQGVDMVEIGIPFSDPLADGPVIQASSQKALKNGMNLRKLFAQLKEMRKEIEIPVILMGYLNPILQFGFSNFCAACKEVGIDGIIIPDLPFAEYLSHYKETAEASGLDMIMLITPETSPDRIRQIDAHTHGFIYVVSSAATTGAQRTFGEERIDYFESIAAMQLTHPTLIGFGISNYETCRAAQDRSRGAIVGSRFIDLLQKSHTPKEAVSELMRCLTTPLAK